MLRPAQAHEEMLALMMRETWYDEKYKFYHIDGWHEEYEACENTWAKHEFVSVDRFGNVIGYIAYKINRRSDMAHGAELICFSDRDTERIMFANDLRQALRDIFEKYFFRKFSFSVVIGNPAMRGYDKLVEKYGGRIVGVQENETKLIDGDYYDMKLYEINRQEYMSAKRKMKRRIE